MQAMPDNDSTESSVAATVTLFVVITVVMILLATTTEWSSVVRLPLSLATGFLAAFLVRRFARRSGRAERTGSPAKS